MSGADVDPVGQAAAIERLLESARAMNIEIDRDEAEEWVATLSAESSGSVTVDVSTGTYGHRVTMADHDDAALDRFRRMTATVGFEDRPPTVTTALALSGSAAQSRIHRFPADADFTSSACLRLSRASRTTSTRSPGPMRTRARFDGIGPCATVGTVRWLGGPPIPGYDGTDRPNGRSVLWGCVVSTGSG